VVSTNAIQAAAGYPERIDALQAFILHHVSDAPSGTLPLIHATLPPYISRHGSMVILAAVTLVVLFGAMYRRKAAVPTGLTNLLEVFVVFVRDQIACRYFGEEQGRRMTPLFCSFFFFILMMNLIGLVPLFSTATANISVTGALAAVTLCFMIFGALFLHGPIGFIKGFVPRGVPWPVLLLLVPIEIVGLFIKAFALMIRLFANELSGHMVVFFMLGLVVVFGAKALPIIVMALMIYILELMVAFLQAYIFTLLSAVFISQRFHPEH